MQGATFEIPFSPVHPRHSERSQTAPVMSEAVRTALDALHDQGTFLGRLKNRCFKCLSIQNILDNLSDAETRELLDAMATLAILHKDGQLVQCCLNNISPDKFLRVSETRLNDSIEETISSLNLSIEETHGTKHYTASITHHVQSTTIRLLEVIVNPFVYFSIYSDPASNWDATQRVGVYSQIIIAPFLFLSLMNSLLTSSLMAVTVTVATLGIVVLGLVGYVFLWRPFPQEILKFQHMTDPVKCQDMQEIIAAEVKFNEIVTLLRARINPLLVGDPGTGKSTIANEVFRQLGLGLIPDLKEIKVLAGNGTDLTYKPGVLETRTLLDLVLNRSYLHLPRTIIYIEDIDRITTDEKAWEQILKNTDPTSRADDSPWAYFAATTKKGLAELLKKIDKGELERRMRPVNLDEMTEENTIIVLDRIARQVYSELTVEKGALEELVKRTKALYPERAHPDAPIKELSRILTNLRGGNADQTVIEGLALLNRKREKARIQYQEAVGTTSERGLRETYRSESSKYTRCKQMEKILLETHEQYKNMKFKIASFKKYIASVARQITLNADGPRKEALKKNMQFSLGFIRPQLDKQANTLKETVIKERMALKEQLLREQEMKSQDEISEDPYELTGELVKRMIPEPVRNL